MDFHSAKCLLEKHVIETNYVKIYVFSVKNNDTVVKVIERKTTQRKMCNSWRSLGIILIHTLSSQEILLVFLKLLCYI